MAGGDATKQIREAFAGLPKDTGRGVSPAALQVHLPRSHLKAMQPNVMLVTGMPGSGKTFWWGALQDAAVRHLVGGYTAAAEVRAGFGVRPAPDEAARSLPGTEDHENAWGSARWPPLSDQYPGKDVLTDIVAQGIEPGIVWRTVLAWQLAEDAHPLRNQCTWLQRTAFVRDNPETIERLFRQRDAELDRRGGYFMILFDALDRCADDWQQMGRMIRGLMQSALEMRAYRRLRVKLFLRADEVAGSKLEDLSGDSSVLSSAMQLNWPRRELYGLLWHCLGNGRNGTCMRTFLGGDRWSSVDVGEHSVFPVPREIVTEEWQRRTFRTIAGPAMGPGPQRGEPYTWITSHLQDAERRVSPRSLLAALRRAAEYTVLEHPKHPYALHYEGIRRGVQEAATIRVGELRADYPWLDQVVKPLAGLMVPCAFGEVAERWRAGNVLDRLQADAEQRLPPRHVDEGFDGVRLDLESLGVFQRLLDGRVNVPEVFRVGYGLGRKGGVRPSR